MKKIFSTLFLFALACSVQATIEKLEFKLTDTEFVPSYTGTNTANTETGALAISGNSSVAWDRYYKSPKYDLSTYDRFVLRLKEAAPADLLLVINQKGFWETVGNDEGNADHGIGYIGTLKAGQTELSIPLAGLKSNMSVHSGTALDLSDIWMINLWTGGGGAANTFMFEEMYAEREVLLTPFDWAEAKAEWGEENMVIDAANKTITKTNGAWEGNNAVSWFNYVATDISAYDRLVLRLTEASNGPVEVVVSNGGFWGGKCHSAVLATGGTELSLTLNKLKITGTPGAEETWATGDPLDLKNVNLIFIRTDNGTANQVIKVDFFGFETDPEAEDETPVVAGATMEFTLATANKEWSPDFLTFDTENNTIIYDRGQDFGNAAASWLAFTKTDISQYKSLVLELEEASSSEIEILISEDGFWGCDKGNSTKLTAGQTYISYDLATLTRTSDSNPLDLTNINLIFLRTAWTNQQTIKIKSFRLEAPSTVTIPCTQSGKLGTICLPYNATVEGATLYSVSGVDSKEMPKTLYLDEVGTALTAGVAYIYESTAAADIVCTLTSSDKVAAATDGALVGTYAATTAVADTYVLSAGKWLKVVAGDEPTIGANKAYLNLENVTETSAGVKAMSFVDELTIGIGLTPMDEVGSSKFNVQSSKIYNLAGQRMNKLQKGVNIVNGKKVLVK